MRRGFERPLIVRLVCRVAFAILVALASVRVGAQPVPERVVDTRLRIETRHMSIVTGRVVRVSADSVVLREDQTRDFVGLAQTDILIFEESLGSTRGRMAIRGGLYGAGLGLVLVALAGTSDANSADGANGITNLALALPVAVILPLIGAGIGAAKGGEKWKQPTSVHIGAAVHSSDVLSVGFSWTFD